jgi:pimeloyl-ACP methyl ester carboxylesterase
MDAIDLDKVVSCDGTPIAFYRNGTGSPLILVPGTGAANPAAWPVIPALEEHFSVYAVDRRGRGESGDGPTYAIDREFEDIAAVVDSIGEPADLLGHSFAALLALEAALLTQNLCRLILYEPWITRPGIPAYPEGYIDRLEAQLEAGDREGVLITHYREDAGLTPDEIEKVKSSPVWSARLATVHTLPREMRAEERYRFDAQRFKDLHTPTLLLLGGESSQVFKESTESVDEALPNSCIAILPGQKHIAMYTAPELFVGEVVQFLGERCNG